MFSFLCASKIAVDEWFLRVMMTYKWSSVAVMKNCDFWQTTLVCNWIATYAFLSLVFKLICRENARLRFAITFTEIVLNLDHFRLKSARLESCVRLHGGLVKRNTALIKIQSNTLLKHSWLTAALIAKAVSYILSELDWSCVLRHLFLWLVNSFSNALSLDFVSRTNEKKRWPLESHHSEDAIPSSRQRSALESNWINRINYNRWCASIKCLASAFVLTNQCCGGDNCAIVWFLCS